MADRFISLSCQSCGGTLHIYDDMERFACGYCGTEMTVERRGGTVALKAVAEAIQRVQVGTDKTAAELALARYQAELNDLRVKQAALAKGSSEGCVGFGCGGLFVVLGIMGVAQGAGLGWLAAVAGAC